MSELICIDPGTITGFATSLGRVGTIDLTPLRALKGSPAKPAKIAKRDGRILRPAVPAVEPRAAEPENSRCGKLYQALDREFPGHCWRAVVCEGATAFQRGKAAVRVSHELRGVVKAWCWINHIEYVEVQPMDLKRYSCGKFDAGKDEMIEAARARLGYAGSSDDEADALWLLEWADEFVK